MRTYKSIDTYWIEGRGRVFVVANDEESLDFKHLIREKIEIDGKNYICMGVERHAKGSPTRVGEPIGILVK